MKHQFNTDINDLKKLPEIKDLFEDADYVGLKIIESEDALKTVLSKMFSYRPALVRLLYRIRAPFVRLLGFRQDAMPQMKEWLPDEFPMLPCGNVWFFTVRKVVKDRLWIAGCPRDRHLDADMAVVAQQVSGKRYRFHIVTFVRYKHWTGPLYFNVIRLFSMILVNRMAKMAVGF
jgi:hypothetical protein